LLRNYLLKYTIGGRIERRILVVGRRGRRLKHVLDDFKEARGYHKLEEEALDCTLWGNRFRRDYGPVLRETTV